MHPDEYPKSIDLLPNITEGLTYLVDSVQKGRAVSASLSILDSNYQTAPYVQFSKFGESLVTELISNSFIKPKLTAWEEGRIRSLGWNDPTQALPNFWSEFSSSDSRKVAIFLVSSLRVAFDLNKESWFTFGSSQDELPLIKSDLFWHSSQIEHVLCLPGSRLHETLEGRQLLRQS